MVLNLHQRVEAEVRRRLAVAQAVTSYDTLSISWPRTAGKDALLAHLRLHDPADAVLRYERDLEMLGEHKPEQTRWHKRPAACAHEWSDGDGWYVPADECHELRRLARSLGIEPDGEGGETG